ncbi:MAG: response regulator transcription factor [Candidatus Promineofilum sp.]|uniref:response regulator transcription factor n=1 Tax=Promineifilum sp. TaxID=2664178 RepID=UPI002411EE28|nr:response regulator transcription factor [Promineifilum sp.]
MTLGTFYTNKRMRMIDVLIADDHAIVRRGLRTLIAGEPDMEVAGEASDGYEVVMRARDLRPDVILMDLVMPGQSGLEALTQIKGDDPEARVLVLTSFGDNERVFSAIRAGASGYLLKDASPEQLLQAIHDVYNGESHLHPTIALKMLRELDNPALAASERPLTEEPLTDRELEVLRLVAQGLSNQEIAKHLTISERTVGNHIGSILRKLHLANRTQAALYALKRGLVDLNTTPPVILEEQDEAVEELDEIDPLVEDFEE